MNISEFARLRGTSKSTLYRRASAAGVDLQALRDDNGDLTPDGMSILAGLVDGSRATPQIDGNSQQRDTVCASDRDVGTLRELERERDALREERDSLRGDVKQLRQQVAELQSDRADQAERHAAALAAILERQQANEERRLLLESGTQQPERRGGFLGRLFGRNGRT